jgi:hypothetical protein
MILKKFGSLIVLAALFNESFAAYGQIIGGAPCSDDQVDAVAICFSRVFCAQPPSPIPAFDIGARSFSTCPNQPVDNFAQVDVTIGGVQAVATAQARALIFNRLIHREIRGGDCSGNAPLLFLFDDPQGCDPPPPPPPACGPPPPDQEFTSNNPDDSGDCEPLVMDVMGEGFHLTDTANGVVFDIRADGRPFRIPWTAGSQNAFLALDRNKNGMIDDGSELFGNKSPQPLSAHPNGFLALAVYDKPANGGNGDGMIDSPDLIFPQLRLWVDANHDGISQPGELHTLPEMGIFSIGLDYSLSRRTDEFGNVFRYKARINQGVNGDPDVGKKIYDVFFVTK